jgi:exonuclease VII small subunit
MSAEEALARAEELLAKLESTRAELERLSEAQDADRALAILSELADLSKQVEDELQRAKREVDDRPDAHT